MVGGTLTEAGRWGYLFIRLQPGHAPTPRLATQHRTPPIHPHTPHPTKPYSHHLTPAHHLTAWLCALGCESDGTARVMAQRWHPPQHNPLMQTHT